MNETIAPSAYLLETALIKHLLTPRPRDAHKGEFGHVLVIGGNRGMSGAVRMAAAAAARVGAGLVTVATHPEHATTINIAQPELMCTAIYKAEDIAPLLKKATVLVIGPGLGQDEWAQNVFSLSLQNDFPKLLDADALNLLAKKPYSSDKWILTPHPGEAARLLQITSTNIQKDRFFAARAIQENFGGVCVLKGSGTLIQNANKIPAICSAGNPGMATAGMGDILSGIIGGFLAQGFSLDEAAELGVLVHAIAGDKAAEEGERGLIATDLLGKLRQVVNSLC